MNMLKKVRFIPLMLTLLLVVMMVAPASVMAAQPTVNLGTTSSFAVLAGTTVTNTGPTTISGSKPEGGGDVGMYSGSAITDLAQITMTGWTAHINDPTTIQATADLVTAYDDAAGRSATTTFTSTDNQLGGKTLTSGVYAFGHADTANLTAASPLILDAQGNEEAVFIFQASSDLVIGSGSKVILINGGKYCRVFWQVTSSATLGTYSQFVGHIFAYQSIWAKTGATVQGQLLARNGEVTLDTNTITNGLCITPVSSISGASSGGSGTPISSPKTSDNSSTGIFTGVALLAIVSVVISSVFRKKVTKK
jgi:hypothetical protein